MNRFPILVLVCCALSVASCSEKAPLINFGTATNKDTTYTGAVETAQARRVLIEEFTGVKCSNCPTGHAVLAGFSAQYPGRIAVIGYQAIGDAQTLPIQGETRSDNRTEKGTNVGKLVFGGVPALPVAGFDRVPVSGQMLNNRTVWAAALNNRMSLPAPVNVTLTSSYDAATRQVTVKARVAYTAEITGKQRLSLAITESKLVDAQESTDTVYAEYDHEHVFRDMLTAPDGDAMLDAVATKSPGRVYERSFVFLLNSAWKAENCALIGFVHSAEASGKEVYQSAEIPVR